MKSIKYELIFRVKVINQIIILLYISIVTIAKNIIMRSVEEEIEEKYDCIEKLGQGAFGNLILVRSKNNEQYYACKI